MTPPLVWCVSGSRDLGLGHVIRSLRVGLALEAQGAEVYFAGHWRDGADAPFWRRHPLHLQRFVSAAPLPHDEVEWLIDRLRAQVVVFDLLLDESRDRIWLEHLHQRGIQTVALHEHAFPWAPVTLAVSPTVVVQSIREDVPEARDSFQGVDYLLVDPRVTEASGIERQPRTCAVVVGGADPQGLRASIVRTLLDTPDFAGWRLVVVQGPAMAPPDWAADARIEVLEQPASLLSLFQEATLAITNGGTTCYEALAAGARVLAIPQNPFEAAVIAWFESRGVVRTWSPAALADWQTLTPGTTLIDGRGVERIAGLIQALAATSG